MVPRFTILVLVLAAAVTGGLAVVPLTLPDKADVGPGRGFERRVEAYLMAHPQVILDAVARLERQGAAAEAARQRQVLRANHAALSDPTPLPPAGNSEGDVTVVEFFDYRCPYCRRAVPELRALLEADPGVKLVFKEFPVLGPESLFAARAAIAAAYQGRYLVFHNALMTYPGELDAAAVMGMARELGLDIARLEADMDSPATSRVIESNHALGQRIGIGGTPSFIIGDVLVPGYVRAGDLGRLVAEARR